MDNTSEIQICFARDKVVFNTGKPSPQPSPVEGEGVDQHSLNKGMIVDSLIID
jgi:hypothetical protein